MLINPARCIVNGLAIGDGDDYNLQEVVFLTFLSKGNCKGLLSLRLKVVKFFKRESRQCLELLKKTFQMW